MNEAALTRERILEAAEEVLRRFGPAKANVVDVARALEVSHGSVYRHFPSKAALRDAVTERWLERMMPPLEAVADAAGPAAPRLRRWFDLLLGFKHGMARQEPELFATYLALAEEAREVVQAHVAALTGQLARIIADGAATGEFTVADPAGAAQAVFAAAIRFHHPAHAGDWAAPGLGAAFEGVWALILGGLGARPAPPSGTR